MIDEPSPADMVSRVTQDIMGPAAAPPPNDPLRNPAAAAPAESPPAPSEEAAEAGPKDEGDRMEESPLEFIKIQDKVYSKTQLESLLNRYKDLNFTHAQYKPVIAMTERIMQAMPGTNPEQVVGMIEGLAKAQQHNPTMGETPPPAQPQSAPQNKDVMTDYRAWEQETGSVLPPGYEEIQPTLKQLQGMVGQLVQQNAQLSQAMLQQAGESQRFAQAHEQQSKDARAQLVAANMTKVQQELGLDPEKYDLFMTFAQDRGYDPEAEFHDEQMVARVMGDFKNSLTAQEAERLRAVAKRRLAYMGSLEPTTGAPAPTEPKKQPSLIDSIVDNEYSQRGIS